MIEELRRLRDLLDAIDRQFDDPDDRDPVAIDEALAIVDRLLHQHERPAPVKVNACMRLPTPPAPAAPVIPIKKSRPEGQKPVLSQKRKPKPQPKPQAAAK